MELIIDGRPIDAQPGETLLTLVRRLGLDTGELKTRPLAAYMAGDNDGVTDILKPDLYVPGCPPHPAVLLEALIRFMGRRLRND